MQRRHVLGGLAASVLGHGLAQAAETYPARPVRLVVGFAPGGGGDAIARLLAESLSRTLKQTVIVDNRPGANTTLAAAHVASAPADGYTLLLGLDAAFGADKALYATVRYDENSFTPISRVASTYFVLAAGKASGIRRVADLQAKTRGDGKPMFLASPGGVYLQVLVAEMNRVPGVAIEEVLYKGGAPAALAVMAGETALTLMGPGALLPLMRDGKVVALASTTSRRSNLTPDVPTLSEEGVPGVNLSYWFGLMGPAGLPDDISRKLFAATKAALDDTVVRQKLATLGYEASPSDSPEEFRSAALKDGAALRARIRQAGIQQQ